MQTPTVPGRPPSILLVVALALTVAACGGSALPAPATPTPGTPAASGGTGGGDEGRSGGGSGSAPGNPGIVDPGLPGGGPVDNPDGEPQLVEPVPGAILVRDAGATALNAAVNGRRVAVKVAFWGGVEPCDVLAGVNVARDGNTFTLTVRSGTAPDARDIACIQIAVLKATIVDLGELEPGTYTIRAAGDAAPIEVVVS